jgi:hypothetical protein
MAKLFYLSTGMGACIRVAEDEDDAYEKVLREVGTDAGVDDVREATEQDIEWVRGMGGRVPTLPRVQPG